MPFSMQFLVYLHIIELSCRTNEFQCLDNGRCIDLNLRCDRRNDCSDGSDEYNCPTEPPFIPPETTRPTFSCPYGYQHCQSQTQCIRVDQFCDGRVDCSDLSDETNCPFQTERCSKQEFRCENGPCIRKEFHCDGKVDCPLDTSDELDCDNYGTRRDYTGSSQGLNLRTYPNSQEIKESKSQFYQRKEAAAMGLLLLSALVNIYIEAFEKKTLDTSPLKLKCWFRLRWATDLLSGPMADVTQA
ncbi:hypothetical protein NQ315_013908 [Exocentrus adspersus]|uniref:Uncharacterized protein n=1 Tax=Exocentrus adspersus TaxID=1586481 RepID=A0AAV8VR46_9CUCU|nr:hypothetical protein NQ315_013908 [Exocentrus adspersus]